MSEQVGASLVLAQVLLPTQSGASTQAPATGNSPLDGIQHIDSIDENAPFSALLTELRNLEARTPAGTDAPLDALITVQVDTRPRVTPASDTGTDLPETGKPLPAVGGVLTETRGLPLPLIEPIEPGDLTLPEPDHQADETIVVRESVIPNSTATIPPAIQITETVTGAANPPSHDAPAVQPPGIAPVTQQPPAPPPTQPDPTLRAAEGQLTPSSNPTAGSADNTGTATDSQNGQNPGERSADRQAQPNLSPRGPSITFSLDGLPSAAMATPASTTATAAQLSQPLTLLGQPAQWAEPLAERLAGLATRGANTAEIRLHPPSLGQLEVRITLTNDQATLFVASANPEVREALQQALPRLDNLLNGLGIELAESEIAERQADDFQSEADDRAGAESGGSGESSEQPGERSARERLSLLDTWA